MNSLHRALEVLEGGMLSLVEDGGRQHVAHLGLTQGGVMDRHAWAWGNRLLGNHWGEAAIEITIGGFKGRFSQATQIALTGADLNTRLNGQPVATWETLTIKAGDLLETGYAAQGLRGYLCVRGGWKTPVGLGNSRSAIVREQLGGQDGLGSPLKAGDQLSYACTRDTDQGRPCSVPLTFRPAYQAPLILDFCDNPASPLPAQLIETLLAQRWTLSSRSNRMAALLDGQPLQVERYPLVSSGVAAGTLQLPPSGQPIILLNERQSIGGYPQPGFVTLRSLDRLAQGRPGEVIQFRRISLAEAQQQEGEFLSFFQHSDQAPIRSI